MIGKFLSLFSSLILLFASSSVAPASTNISENRYLGSNETLYSIYAPASPTVQLSERYQGKFAQPNMPLDFLISVYTYFGQEGIYNITTNSTWPVFFYSASGKFLEDTNGDGIIDTGETAVAEQFDVHVRIIPPVTLNPGDSDNFDVVLSSVQYPGQQVITSIQVAVPAPFAHIYNGRSTGEFGMSMWDVAISIYRSEQANTVYLANDLLRPTGGWDNSIVEAQPGNFVYISQSYDSKFAGYEVDCSKLDRDGNPVWPVIVLDDHSNSMISTSDDTPTVAVSPDGSVGIVWQRTMMTNLGTNTNIYFAIIDSSGHLKNGLVNVTNNQVVGSINDPNYPSYDLPVIAATSNNSFFLAWHHGVSSPGWVDNIDYAIFTSSGEVLKAPTNLTNAQVGSGNLFSAPSVAGLSNQRVLITYLNGNPFNLNLWYLVLDSSGNTVSSPKLITDDGTSGSAWIRADSAELSNGRIIVAWNTYQDLRFVILDSSYSKVAGPIFVSHPALDFSQYPPFAYLSVTAGIAGKAVLSWGDPIHFRNLYYALINPDGSYQTPPMIFQYSPEGLIDGIAGYNNTSYSFPPTSSNVDMYISAPLTTPVMPNKVAEIPIQFGNQGSATASGIQITATLGSGQSYVSDSSGVTPAIQDSQITWNLPGSLGFLGAGKFDLRLSAPQVEIGSSRPVTLTIHTTQQDGNPGDNTFVAQVTIPAQPYMYFPIIAQQSSFGD